MIHTFLYEYLMFIKELFLTYWIYARTQDNGNIDAFIALLKYNKNVKWANISISVVKFET